MNIRAIEAEVAARREPEPTRAWIRSDLACRHGAVLKEEIPAEMARLLADERP